MLPQDVFVIRKDGKYLAGTPEELADKIGAEPDDVMNLVYGDRVLLKGWKHSPKSPREAMRISGRPKIKDQVYKLTNFDGCILEGKPEALAGALRCDPSTIYNLVCGRRRQAKGFRVMEN